jgi:uncharacterized protein GlcG (DUF336 family)
VFVATQALPSSAAGKSVTAARQAAAAAAGTSHSAVRSQRVLKSGAALKLVTVAVASCAKTGNAVTATVVDADGIQLASLRGDGATGATVPVALGKAVASAGFKSPSGGLAQGISSNPGLVTVPDFVLLAGGEPIFSHGTLVGALGVSGAPTGDIDDACAKAALATIKGSL